MRWYNAGKRPGSMYWLRPGSTFANKALVRFAGLHDMRQDPIYFTPGQPALAIFVKQPEQEEMVVTCTGAEGISSLQMSMDSIASVRLLNASATKGYKYCGMWLITDINRLSADQAEISLFSMPA